MSNRHRNLFRCAILGLLFAASAHSQELFHGPLLLDPNLPGWDADNCQRLNQLLIDYRAKPGSGGTRRSVAVFDWDNSMVKNDIGDATFFWMIQHDKFLQP